MAELSSPPPSTRPDDEGLSARRCLREAVALQDARPVDALRWIRRVVDLPTDFAAWKGSAALLDSLAATAQQRAKRTVRLGVVGSYTTPQLVELVRLAAYRYGVWTEVYQAGFDQYHQEILDEGSGLYRFAPDVVLIAVHEGALDLPAFSADPRADVGREVDRWTALWHRVQDRSGASVVQHTFAVPPDAAHGHLAASLPGVRSSMARAVDAELGARTEPGVTIVDCDAVASRIGKAEWFDDRYWFLAKQAVSLAALPELARHTAAMLAAQLGLSRKALVVDLDGTLWGGTIGDDGLEGIRLGSGSAEGEAHLALQGYCKALVDRGVILAVCSKNDDHTARLPFLHHPDMALSEDDIAVFVANWQPKPDNLRHIAETLSIGLDAIVFVDDNPAEREAVRRLVPEVEVVALPPDPARYVEAVAGTLLFEAASLTDEDRRRTEQYRARAATKQMETAATSLEEFHRDLGMEAVVAPFDELHLPRITQLIMKTNQFNLTTRRHGEETVRRLMADPSAVGFYVKLRDRLADHGLVAVVIGRIDGDTMDIDTWVMSCRVIGRTVEQTVLASLTDEARQRGLTAIRGTYIPSGRNGLVAGLYGDLGFTRVNRTGGTETWTLDVPSETRRNEYITEPAWV